jgi:two-component system LytT family sensor kinase
MAGIFLSGLIGGRARSLRRKGARQRVGFDGRAGQGAFDALHLTSLAAPPLRGGLTESSAAAAGKHLRELLSVPALAATDTEGLLSWDGTGEHHAAGAVDLAAGVLAGGRTVVVKADRVWCGDARCGVRQAVVAPLVVEDRITGTLIAYAPDVSAGLVRATGEVARWMSGQLELAERARGHRHGSSPSACPSRRFPAGACSGPTSARTPRWAARSSATPMPAPWCRTS